MAAITDVLTPEQRHRNMSNIRSTGSMVERKVFRYLRSERIYFQKHYKNAPGKPDVAKPRKKLAVFIDGDFWHGYNFDEKRKRLSSGYWITKIETNMARDRRNDTELVANGWKVLRIWDRDLKTKQRTAESFAKIREFLLQE
jgi:DNA mismatch endonuclease, patch repair protein